MIRWRAGHRTAALHGLPVRCHRGLQSATCRNNNAPAARTKNNLLPIMLSTTLVVLDVAVKDSVLNFSVSPCQKIKVLSAPDVTRQNLWSEDDLGSFSFRACQPRIFSAGSDARSEDAQALRAMGVRSADPPNKVFAAKSGNLDSAALDLVC